jgi:hypothetical protein
MTELIVEKVCMWNENTQTFEDILFFIYRLILNMNSNSIYYL